MQKKTTKKTTQTHKTEKHDIGAIFYAVTTVYLCRQVLHLFTLVIAQRSDRPTRPFKIN